jgi:bis(5'-nucleosyl)-tetraphosphatase (symmetrical)
MSIYAIGDLQGCHASLVALLARLDVAEAAEVAVEADTGTSAISDPTRYVFVGDLVNRGPESLQTLRHIIALGPRARTVLGNHDLHLLAAAHGIRRPGRRDTIAPILQAPDRDALLDWLRRQPLALHIEGHLLVHAGVLPQWDTAQTLALAGEVSAALQGPHWIEFLRNMYGNAPARWDPALQGHERLRCIVNALTRVRRCTPDGSMVHDETVVDAATAATLLPWFDLPQRRTAETTVVYGHWSALGLRLRPHLLGLDSGCVWGGCLSAVRLSDRALFQVHCAQAQVPDGAG